MEATLKREKFAVQAEVKLPDLFLEAKMKLGYEPAAISEADRRETRRRQELEVAAALDSLGIEPLSHESVERYQRQQVTKVVERSATRFVRYMHSPKGEMIVTLLGVFGVCSFIGLVCAIGANVDDHKLAHAAFLGHLWQGWLTVLGTWAVLMVARHKRAVTFSAAWYSLPLAGYRHAVPEFAIARALEVKSVLPDARFEIDQLVEQQHGVRAEFKPRLPDPFLVLVYGDVKVYLDVWDEPKFEGRRTV